MSLQRAENWFWMFNASDHHYSVDVERVVAWKYSKDGWIGLISPELHGSVLQEPPPVAGRKYKHFDDLTPLELEALKRKKQDPEPLVQR